MADTSNWVVTRDDDGPAIYNTTRGIVVTHKTDITPNQIGLTEPYKVTQDEIGELWARMTVGLPTVYPCSRNDTIYCPGLSDTEGRPCDDHRQVTA
ncbi:hypothetical protein [Kineosporia babensis]|uniref:Uncharacterized protein n=1 Tax=Kineosporia babensis TaxID=499548 RepID=A0A9X1ST30_9ACTN|nr:hypothetical protein [Kineosporia babensis]MCD5310856.1 hypothetical protein [Kineosporia babensis]